MGIRNWIFSFFKSFRDEPFFEPRSLVLYSNYNLLDILKNERITLHMGNKITLELLKRFNDDFQLLAKDVKSIQDRQS